MATAIERADKPLAAAVPKKKKKWQSYAFMFILPSFLIYTLFVIVPTVGSIYLSFTSWDGISEDVRYIGFANFVEIWHSPAFTTR